jgi:hypothetical protein
MKNLLKISCVLAIALFVSMSVNAQVGDTQDGTITTEVVKYLQFGEFDSDVALIYDEFGTTDKTEAEMIVPINGNVDWKLSLLSTSAKFTTTSGKDFPLSKVWVKGMGAALATTAISVDGSKTTQQNLVFVLDNLENQYAGSYTANITFTLAER